MKPTLYILCGAPGCGKSTFASKLVPNIHWVSRDMIRFELIKDNEAYFSHEKEVFNRFVERIAISLQTGGDTIADATHLNAVSRKKLTRAIDNYFELYNIVYVVFTASAETCIKHNKNRTGNAFVPEDIIRKMRAALTIPYNEDMREIGLITIDGELGI